MELQLVSDHDDLVRLSVTGEISQNDIDFHDSAMQDLVGEQVYSRLLLLSLEHCSFIDSSGVSWLLVNHKRFRAGGGRLVIHSVPPLIASVFSVLRLERVFNLADSDADAQRLALDDSD